MLRASICYLHCAGVAVDADILAEVIEEGRKISASVSRSSSSSVVSPRWDSFKMSATPDISEPLSLNYDTMDQQTVESEEEAIPDDYVSQVVQKKKVKVDPFAIGDRMTVQRRAPNCLLSTNIYDKFRLRKLVCFAGDLSDCLLLSNLKIGQLTMYAVPISRVPEVLYYLGKPMALEDAEEELKGIVVRRTVNLVKMLTNGTESSAACILLERCINKAAEDVKKRMKRICLQMNGKFFYFSALIVDDVSYEFIF